MPRRQVNSRARDALAIVLLFLVYFVTARVGLQMDAVAGFATLVWPPTGIALAALFLFGARLWPGVLAGALCVNLVLGASWPMRSSPAEPASSAHIFVMHCWEKVIR